VAALGTAQTIAWASSYYIPAVLAAPMAAGVGLSPVWVFGAFSMAMVVSALVGPWAGARIDRIGGRGVLMLSNLVFAAGLLMLAAAPGPAVLFAGWAVIGLGMGMGLYEGAFATLAGIYGRAARGPITGITLIAGFASTVGWPLSAVLEAVYGWRATCFTWAALHLVLGLPLNALLSRAGAPAPAVVDTPADAAPESSGSATPPSIIPTAVLSFVFAATWFISTAMAAHLPGLMLAAGATAATAILVGSLIGPSQVAARLLEFGLLRRVHPLLSARLAAALHPLGVALLLIAGPAAAPLFGVLHGAGNGILTIVKGTLPLVIFGPQGYGHRQGLLMVPARVAQALAPWLFGLALDAWGSGSLVVSAVIGAAACLALGLLRVDMGRQPSATASTRD
jgi:MFS family permease